MTIWRFRLCGLFLVSFNVQFSVTLRTNDDHLLKDELYFQITAQLRRTAMALSQF